MGYLLDSGDRPDTVLVGRSPDRLPEAEVRVPERATAPAPRRAANCTDLSQAPDTPLLTILLFSTTARDHRAVPGAQLCANARPHFFPVSLLTSKNYYYLAKIGFVSQNRTRSAPPCAFRESGPEGAFGPWPLPRFFALCSQICTKAKPASSPSHGITHTKNKYLFRIGFVSKKRPPPLSLCIREAHRQPLAGVCVAQDGATR